MRKYLYLSSRVNNHSSNKGNYEIRISNTVQRFAPTKRSRISYQANSEYHTLCDHCFTVSSHTTPQENCTGITTHGTKRCHIQNPSADRMVRFYGRNRGAYHSKKSRTPSQKSLKIFKIFKNLKEIPKSYQIKSRKNLENGEKSLKSSKNV